MILIETITKERKKELSSMKISAIKNQILMKLGINKYRKIKYMNLEIFGCG